MNGNEQEKRPTREDLPGVNNGFGTESPLDYAFAVVEKAEAPRARGRGKIEVGLASEIAPGEKKIVEEGALSIGVYNIGGAFFAIKNVCPHAGAPLCQGHIQTTHRPSEVGKYDPALEGRVLRCPWHGWEFDIVTGKGLYDTKSRVATYPVTIGEDGKVRVQI